MGVIRHKIWKDLWANKARTIQVVLIIGMGAFAIGMIIATRNLVVQGMQQSWIDSSPAMIALATSARVDDDTIRLIDLDPEYTIDFDYIISGDTITLTSEGITGDEWTHTYVWILKKV